MNAAESSARAVKATRLADAFVAEITRRLPDVTPAELLASARSVPASTWLLLAYVHGVRLPSAKTIAVTLKLLELRAEPPTDPFDGLPC